MVSVKVRRLSPDFQYDVDYACLLFIILDGGRDSLRFPDRREGIDRYRLGLDSTSIKTYDRTPQYYKDYVARFGGTNLSVPLTLSWASDGRDSYFFPTKGTFQRIARSRIAWR